MASTSTCGSWTSRRAARDRGGGFPRIGGDDLLRVAGVGGRVWSELAVCDHVGAVGDRDGALGALLDEEHRDAALADLGQRLEDLVDHRRREAERRLVEEQDVGRRRARARSRAAAARRRTAGRLRRRNSHASGKVARRARCRRRPRPCSGAGEPSAKVLLDGEVAKMRRPSGTSATPRTIVLGATARRSSARRAGSSPPRGDEADDRVRASSTCRRRSVRPGRRSRLPPTSRSSAPHGRDGAVRTERLRAEDGADVALRHRRLAEVGRRRRRGRRGSRPACRRRWSGRRRARGCARRGSMTSAMLCSMTRTPPSSSSRTARSRRELGRPRLRAGPRPARRGAEGRPAASARATADAPLLAVGSWPAVRPGRPGGEQLGRTSRARAPRAARRRRQRRDLDVLAHRQSREQAHLLEGAHDPRAGDAGARFSRCSRSRRARPASSGWKPERTLTSVVLPAPFGPINPRTSWR